MVVGSELGGLSSLGGIAGLAWLAITKGATTELALEYLNQGLDPAPGTPEQFGAYIRAERIKWARVIKESGAKAE